MVEVSARNGYSGGLGRTDQLHVVINRVVMLMAGVDQSISVELRPNT